MLRRIRNQIVAHAHKDEKCPLRWLPTVSTPEKGRRTKSELFVSRWGLSS